MVTGLCCSGHDKTAVLSHRESRPSRDRVACCDCLSLVHHLLDFLPCLSSSCSTFTILRYHGAQNWMTSRGHLGRCVDQMHVLNDAADVRLMADHRVGSTRPRPKCCIWKRGSTPLSRPNHVPDQIFRTPRASSHPRTSAASTLRLIRALRNADERCPNLARRLCCLPNLMPSGFHTPH